MALCFILELFIMKHCDIKSYVLSLKFLHFYKSLFRSVSVFSSKSFPVRNFWEFAPQCVGFKKWEKMEHYLIYLILIILFSLVYNH